MTCICPSYCYMYARQKFGWSMSAGSFIALISQSKAVGSRKKWTSVTFLTRSWRFYSNSWSQASFTCSQSSSTPFLSCQYSRVMRAVLCSRECNFFDSQKKLHYIKIAWKNVLGTIFFIFLNPYLYCSWAVNGMLLVLVSTLSCRCPVKLST